MAYHPLENSNVTSTSARDSYEAGLGYLENVKVNSRVVSFNGDRVLEIRVPNDNVPVGADVDAPFTRVHVEDLGSVRRSDGHEASGIHFAGYHALFPDERHALFDAVHAVRDLGEVALADLLLLLGERAVVSSGDLQVVAANGNKILLVK